MKRKVTALALGGVTAISNGGAAFVLGVILQVLGHIGLAVRDSSRNSFKLR
jgi:hypothetical protein